MNIICQECGQVLKSFKSLTTHIQFKHDKKDYYDKYLKKNDEGICKICEKPTEFYSIGYGYYKFCSKTCQMIDVKKNNKEMHKRIGKEIHEKKKKTNLERYGVEHNMQRKEIIEQVKKTNIKKYGVENVAQNEKIKKKSSKKRQKTCLKKYGVKEYFMVPEVKEKIKNTFLERYGVENPIQDLNIFSKKEKTGCWAKQHKCGLYYRGSYEKDFLDKYSNIIDIKKGKSFKYEENGKTRVYHSDFYIPSLKLVVEIKNSYLVKRFKENINLKRKSTIINGYKWIMIVDKNYNEFNSIL